jgi:hypothetical protein
MRPVDNLSTPDGAVELSQGRGACSKCYQLADGRMKLYLTRKPLHYVDTNGDHQEIDIIIEDRRSEFVVDKTFFDLSVPKDKIGFTYSSKTRGRVDTELKTIGGVSIDLLPLSINPRVDDATDTIWWDEVVPGIDIYLQVRPGRVEFFKVLKNNTVAKEFGWETVQDDVNNFSTDKPIAGVDNQQRRINVSAEKTLSRSAGGKSTFSVTETFVEQHEATRNRRTRVKEWEDGVEYPVTIDVPDVTENIVAANDDVFENNFVNYTGNIFVGFYNGGPYTTGLRFQTVDIKPGIVIDLAELLYNTNAASSYNEESIDPRIFGVDVDNFAGWASTGGRPRTVPKTGAFAPGDNTTNIVTVNDVTALVQEVVNRPGWVRNNSIGFVISDAEPPGPPGRYLGIFDYGGGGQSASLEITFGIGTYLARHGGGAVFGSHRGPGGSFVG